MTEYMRCSSFLHLQINIYTGGFDSLSPVAQLCVKLWYGKVRIVTSGHGDVRKGAARYGSLGLSGKGLLSCGEVCYGSLGLVAHVVYGCVALGKGLAVKVGHGYALSVGVS